VKFLKSDNRKLELGSGDVDKLIKIIIPARVKKQGRCSSQLYFQ